MILSVTEIGLDSLSIDLAIKYYEQAILIADKRCKDLKIMKACLPNQ